ncbi:ROK family protein [Chloroflexota bacterium]
MADLTAENLVLAVDLGGSKIVTALVSTLGEIVDREYILTLADEGSLAVISRMLSSMDGLLARADLPPSSLPAVCLAVAGAIDSKGGIVTASPNLPGWRNIALREMVQEETGLETFLLNDASAAALGEHIFGIGKGIDNLLYLTVSTGIGGGIIIDGKLYTGVSGSAGELGHMTIDVNGPYCNCGNAGCLEVLASGKAVAREAQRAIEQGAKSIILELAEGETQNITARTVSAAAQKGDDLAVTVISRAATYLGVGMVNLVNAFNPGMIIVGGGMAKMGDMLLDPARKVVAERAFHLPTQEVRIVPSQLGDNAAVLGAAAYVRELAKSL